MVMGIKVKVFDEEHEQDLENKINGFLGELEEEQFIDIKYQVSTLYDYKEQIYCFSALIVYREFDEEDE
jgi:hypothetical protein